MRLLQSIAAVSRRLLYTVKTASTLSRSLYEAIIAPRRVQFFWAVILNFLCRVFNLAAFVASIQAIYIAFQFAISNGNEFRAKQIVDQFGLSMSWLPVVLSGVVLTIFAAPAVLKIIETRQISKIVRENYDFIGKVKLNVDIDLFAITRIPNFITSMVKFFSGTLFIIAALLVIVLFRFDLFLVVLASSIAVAIGVVLGSWRNINNIDLLKPLRAVYIEEAQKSYDSSKKYPIEDILVVPSKSRNAYYSQVISNWAKVNRAVFNQGILTGLAMGSVVFFVFHLEGMSNSFLFVLLYLVIAIRFAINTARETGAMLAKILETRTENTRINAILEARRAA